MLGASAWLQKSFDLRDHPHMTATVSLTFVKIDSWDGERAMVLVDGREVWSSAFGWETQGAQHCGSQNGGWHEVSHDVGPLLVSHYADTLTRHRAPMSAPVDFASTVRCARSCRSTSGARGIRAVCTSRMAA